MEWRRVEPGPASTAVQDARPTQVYVTMFFVLVAGLAVVFARASLLADWNGATLWYEAEGVLLPATTDQIFEWGLMVMAVTSAVLLALRERGGRMLAWVVLAGLGLRVIGFLKDLVVIATLFPVVSPFTVLLLLVGTVFVLLALVAVGVILIGLLTSSTLERHLRTPSPRANA